MIDNQELKNFISLVDSWKVGYTRGFCKYFVVKKGSKNYLLYGLVVFSNATTIGNREEIFVETEQCIAGWEFFDLNDKTLQAILNTLKNTPYELPTNKNIKHSLNLKNNNNLKIDFDPLNHPILSTVSRSPYIKVIGEKDTNLIPDLKNLTIELRNLPNPYQDVHDLFTTFGLPLEILDNSQLPHIEYIATTPLSNMECTICNLSDLQLNFIFPRSVNKNFFKVGVHIPNLNLGENRFCIYGDEFKWRQENDFYKASLTKKFDNLNFAWIYPSYDEQNIGNYLIADPNFVRNNRAEIHDALYDKHPLTDFIFSKNQDEFEFGVSCLLHYLKLASQRYDIDRLKDGPDIIAFSNIGHVYVIECTIGSPNHKGKLLKLHERTQKLKIHFEQKGFDPNLIRPVVFTKQPNENIHEDRAEAANYQISIVAKEDIETLLNRIPNPPTEAELFQAALDAIPNSAKIK